MKKRILTAVLAAALVTGTCAATVSAKEEKTYTIGICQLVQHDALDAATKRVLRMPSLKRWVIP